MANGATVGATGTQNVDALLTGFVWDSLSLRYNFPADLSYYPSDYGGAFPIFTAPASFQAAPQSLRSVVSWAMQEQFMKVSKLTFVPVSSASAADVSIAGVDIPGFAGFGYYPVVPTADTGAALLQRQGDYWYDSPQAARFGSIIRGESTWRLVLHEIGHTVGLKHANELGGVSNTALGADRDSMEFSVMTYRKYIGADPGVDSFSDVERFGAAQSLMMYDIAALQAMYGANYETNSGATTYRWSDVTGEMFIDDIGQGAPGANRIFTTVWDGNGYDTYDLSNYATQLTIDLAPGGWSVFDPAQLAQLSIANDIHARGNVFNALLFNGDPRSLIENAIGGFGNDTIDGNLADNMLDGQAGNDILYGGAGNDRLYGGTGVDVAKYSAGRDLYAVTKSGLIATVSGPEGTDTLSGVERLQFSDGIVRLRAPGMECDGNSQSDIVWRATDGTVALWLMKGSQPLGEFLGNVPLTWQLVDAHGDYNGDGMCDFLWRDSDGTVAVWQMDAGHVTGQVLGVVPASWSIIDGHGDYDGDGRSEILWRNSDGTVAIWSVDGARITGHSFGPVPLSWSIVDAHGDFNGDGACDLLWRASDGTVAIWEMSGGQPVGHVLGRVPLGWSILDGHGDYNGDGRSDLLWRNIDGTVATWEMNGAQVAPHVLAAVPASWNLVDAHGDYNADGKCDLLWRNSDGTVAMWQMNGSQFTGDVLATVPTTWTVVNAHDDYNGDVASDLLWRSTDGTIASWYMDGAHASGQLLGVVPLTWDITDANEVGATVNGGAGDDNVQGTVGRDRLYGGLGHDTLTGGAASDRFVYASLDEGVDVITDFAPGAGGDQLDIHALLIGSVQARSDAGSFVRLVETGNDTMVSVNADGAGSEFVSLAILQGVNGVFLKDLVTQGNIVM